MNPGPFRFMSLTRQINGRSLVEPVWKNLNYSTNGTNVKSNSCLLAFMYFLQTPNSNRIPAARGDGFGRGFRATQCSDTRDPICYSRSPNRFFIAERMRAGGGIDHQLQRSRLEQVDGVRTALVELEYGLAAQTGGVEGGGGAARRN